MWFRETYDSARMQATLIQVNVHRVSLDKKILTTVNSAIVASQLMFGLISCRVQNMFVLVSSTWRRPKDDNCDSISKFLATFFTMTLSLSKIRILMYAPISRIWYDCPRNSSRTTSWGLERSRTTFRGYVWWGCQTGIIQCVPWIHSSRGARCTNWSISTSRTSCCIANSSSTSNRISNIRPCDQPKNLLHTMQFDFCLLLLVQKYVLSKVPSQAAWSNSKAALDFRRKELLVSLSTRNGTFDGLKQLNQKYITLYQGNKT